MSAQTLAVPGTKRGFGSLTRHDWGVLAITMVFWLADGYATFVLLITGANSLHHLLPASAFHDISRYIGYLLALTLLGWATGGILGGMVGDRLGRRKTMIVSIAIYGLFTVLSSLSHNWWELGLGRFLTGIGIGTEWAVGTSLLQEVWPEDLRAKGAGILQGAFSLGGLLVSGLWVILGSTYGVSWRWMYVIGAFPLIVILFTYRYIPESTRWVATRKSDVRLRTILQGSNLRVFVLAFLVSTAITVGWWAVSSYLPTFVGSLVTNPNRVAFFTGWAGALYNIGEIAGCIAFGFLAETFLGRKLSLEIYFLGCIIIVPIVFLAINTPAAAVWLQLIAGFFTGGVFSWYTVHTPELFGTAQRATAISGIFNGTRYLAMIGAVLSGTIALDLGGFRYAAAVFVPIYILGIAAIAWIPETRGNPLPA